MNSRYARFYVALIAPLFFLLGAHAQGQNILSLNPKSYAVTENAGHVSVVVRLARSNSQVVKVNYTTADGTGNNAAIAGSDYTAKAGTLTFAADETSKLVQIPIIDDPNSETIERFTFTISGPTNATVDGNSAVATIDIQDNDGAATKIGFTASSYSVAENVPPTPNPPNPPIPPSVVVTVRRTGNTSNRDTVMFSTSPGSATGADAQQPGADYQNTSGTIVFAPGDTTPKTIRIPIFDDSAVEGNETFAVNLTGPGGNYSFDRSTTTVTIVDNETSSVNFSAASYSVSEDGVNASVTLLRTGNTSGPATVKFSTFGGTARADVDFAAVNRDVRFAANQTSATVDLPILDDNAVEGTESFYVTLSASPNSGVIVPNGTVTAEVRIIDNENTNTVEFAGTDFSVNEQAGNATITVRLNRAQNSNNTVSVRYFTETGSATAGQDYTAIPASANRRITFGPDESIKTFTIPIVNDTIPENAETIGLVLADPIGATLGTTSAATLSILDNDSAGAVQFSTENYSVSENAGTVTLTVLLNRTGNTNSPASVHYTTAPGSAASSRFVQTSGTINFLSGSAVATIVVPIVNDSTIEPPQNFFVVLSQPVNASLGTPSSAAVTIQDDDGLNTVEFDAAEFGAVEIERSVQVRVRALRGGDPNQILTVNLAFGAMGDTATNPADYQNPSSTTVTFPAGVNVQDVTIPITYDLAAQGVKTFTVRLTNPGQFTSIGRQSSARVTIFDNAGPNTVQFLTAAHRFREGDQAAIAITMVRFGAFTNTGTNVQYRTELRAGDTARAGVNFTPVQGEVRFAPVLGRIGMTTVVIDNEHTKIILIPIPDNNLIEGDVTFHLTITGSDVAQFGNISTTKITITDDDLGNLVQFSSSTYSVLESAGNAILKVNLIPNGDAGRATTVNYSATPISAFAGFDFSPVSGTLTFAPGETSKNILVPINNDGINENPETFRVTLNDPSPGALVGTPSSAITTIIDDDVQSVVQFSPANYTVSELGGSITLTIVANRQGSPGSQLTVGYQTSGGTATQGADYVGKSGSVTFAPGETQKTVTIQISNDGLIESTENFFVNLTNPGAGVGLGTASTATIEIVDDDSPNGSIGFSAASFDVDEGAGTANLTVTRSGGFGVSATVNYSTANGTAVAGVNYQQRSGSITFAAGQVSKTIQIPIIDDTTANPTLNFTVTLTSPNGTGFVGGQSTATVNILDNDATSFRFNPTDYSIDEGSGTVTLTVEALRVGDQSAVVSVDYVTGDGTASQGVKYERTAGVLTFDAGVSRKTITVPIIDNNIKEGTQFFFVTLSNPQGGQGTAAARISDGKAKVTIIDNDATTFQFSAPTYTVNNSAGNATLTVTLSRLINPNGTFSVSYATANSTAIAGRDYTPASGRLTFGPGETSKSFTVNLIDQPIGTPTRSFRVNLSNPSNGAELGTSTATVVINNFDLSTKLRNVSTRAPVETGDAVMIAGFIVEGNNKQVVLRAIGPSLTQFGVVNAIQDPTLQLMDANGNQVAYNDDYPTNTSGDRQALSDSGLTPADPRESALVVTLRGGPHTAILRGKTNGVGLVEVYDIGSTTTSRLVNISTRAKVKEGDNGALIAGFIVSAPNNGPGTAQEVVIRAIGPSLANFGVTGELEDTTLDIYRGSLKVYSNDNWRVQTGTGVGSAESIEATGLQPSDDNESAVRLTLDPGSYSAVVRGRDNTTGIALVEVYQLH